MDYYSTSTLEFKFKYEMDYLYLLYYEGNLIVYDSNVNKVCDTGQSTSAHTPTLTVLLPGIACPNLV